MSIYAVSLQEWYPKPKYKNRDTEDYNHNLFLHKIAKIRVKFSKCFKCKKHCKWNRSWGHHTIPFGYGDIWCSKNCVFGK
jgi:hypothetical protein